MNQSISMSIDRIDRQNENNYGWKYGNAICAFGEDFYLVNPRYLYKDIEGFFVLK
jgi:hypothetical protein